MLFYAEGSATSVLSDDDLREGLRKALDAVEAAKGRPGRVLALPPDQTRAHSRAGFLTRLAYDRYGSALTDVMPALGTHAPMGAAEIAEMFPGVPPELFRAHRWRTDIETLGEVPASYVESVSEGKVSFPWPAQANRMLVHGGHDLILSIGQVVPHEVIGMANYTKNVYVGTGGAEGINKSHFLGAVYGMERIMGRASNPVRSVIDHAHESFGRGMPIVFVLTVVAREKDGRLAVKGLFVGDDSECFHRAAELSLKVNFELLDAPLRKVVVYLDPKEFKSTWLGNKSVYRTRMAIADGGELLVLAPGVKEFGEDPEIDRLIRKYGYKGTPRTLENVERSEDLRANLSAAAHLIHGSSEGRFAIRYAPGRLTREETEGVGFGYEDLGRALSRYDPARLSDGPNVMPDGEEIFFVSNPAVGLWAWRNRFEGA